MGDKETTAKPKPAHPMKEANFLSVVFFCWAFPIFFKGYRKDLDEEDLYEPLSVHKSATLGDRLEKAWSRELAKNAKPSLWRALRMVFGLEVFLQGVALLSMEMILKISQPLCLGKLITYYSPNQTEVSQRDAYIYAFLIVLASFLGVLTGHAYMLSVQQLGMKIRVACCSLIYRKSLRLSKTALASTTIGQLVNLLSNDVNRFDYAMIHFHNLWVAPVETLVILYLLYWQVGLTGTTGTLFLVMFVPLQMYLGKKTSQYRLRTAIKTDERVRLMGEIVSGIQVIKMYTWEKPFAKLVAAARKLEIKQIRATSYVRATLLSFSIFTNRFAIFLTVLAYVLWSGGGAPQAKYVFVVTGFYNILRQAMTVFFPQGISQIAEAAISVGRLRTFLLYEETATTANKEAAAAAATTNGVVTSQAAGKTGVCLRNATARWTSEPKGAFKAGQPENTLSNVDLSVGEGELVAVVGEVGAGKTSLLHVILKELPLAGGSAAVRGRVSYASQEPWLFAATLRQNILFGQPVDEKRYAEVVRVCALERDLELLAGGDGSYAGDRGVALSGGQKARVNLARAVYKEADVYLLDDPLSAVDANVGRQLFDECVRGFLRGKCVVLVTHQVQYLRNVDKVVVMEGGRVSAVGTYAQLRDSVSGFGDQDEEDDGGAVEDVGAAVKAAPKKDAAPPPQAESREQRSSGRIKGKVYGAYLKAGGSYWTSAAILAVFFVAQITASGNDYFISYWVNLEERSTADPGYKRGLLTTENCIYIYATVVTTLIALTFTRSLTFFRYCMRASTALHNEMFAKIVHGTMRFFDTNPSGRILNRFSKDMGSIDEMLPSVLIDTMQIGLNVVGISTVIAIVNPWIIIPTVTILTMFYFMRVVYLRTSRNVKRLEGTTRSPVFTHLNSSLRGLTTIRAFGAQDVLKGQFDDHQDLHSSAFFMFLGCTRTFGFWLDFVCVVYIAIVTVSFLVMGEETPGGNVGLAVTQAVGLTGMFQWGMRQWSELENQMTAVERVVEYTEVEREVDDAREKPPPKGWPRNGSVEFRDVSLRYSPEGPHVLRSLSFAIAPTEKVGIVGRTGAGKSSLIVSLFRLAEVEGDVLVDGLSTRSVPLHALRSSISIIPQEPVLFSGTLRKNLDPFEEYSDGILWKALEEVELKAAVSDLPAGINSKMSEGGSNFSVGQRQLVCLARAIIRNNKILVLDEATANVDPKTDSLIQKTIRKKFADCTVLTIAHRLHTVMDCDKILVMDAGRAVEFDHPHVLLENREGVFRKLVQQTGKAMADALAGIAETNYDGLKKGDEFR